MPALEPDRITDLLTSATADGTLRHARRKRRGARFVATVLVGALLLVIAGGAGALWVYQLSINNNIERLEDPFATIDEATRPSAAPSDPAATFAAMNILVLGSDSRISAGDPSQWQAGAQRTDAIMLVHLPADRQSAQVMSIPRDSWVPIPGYGDAKINAAFSYGGPSLMIQTVEQLTGVRIDHFAVTDFVSFTTLTDALGGVDILIPEDVGSGDTFFAAGEYTMSGEQALVYARERYGLANGDFGRVQRQQNWMRAILAKANTQKDDLGAMARLVEAFSRSVTVDEGFTFNEMTQLALSATELSSSDVIFMTVPYSGTGRSPDGKQSIVLLDRARFDPLMAAVAGDTVATYIGEHPGELTVLPAIVK